MDPILIKLENFEGDKKDRRNFTKWRKTFENHAEHYDPGIKLVLRSIQRYEGEVTVDVIRARLSDCGLTEYGLHWNIDTVDSDVQSFLECKTAGEAQSTVEGHELGGFESFRLLNVEFDPITQKNEGCTHNAHRVNDEEDIE